jgi:hypothetical protein
MHSNEVNKTAKIAWQRINDIMHSVGERQRWTIGKRQSALRSSFYFYAFVFTIGCAEFSRLVLHGWSSRTPTKCHIVLQMHL